MNTEYPPRHLPPFRPLVPGEQWHRLDFTPEMLPDGWRPLLLGEIPTFEDQYRYPYTGEWTDAPSQGEARSMSNPRRTRRPLPPPPPTFEHGGKVWNSHIPGDPCPVDGDTEVYVLYVDSTVGHGCANDFFWELDKAKLKIGYRIPEAEPVNDADKMRERMERAERALISHGWTYTEGAQEWKPPVNVQAAKDNQRIVDLEKDKKQLVQDWADDYTHLQKLCFASGYTEPQVYGDTHSTPAIQDLADMLKARISELEQQLATAIRDAVVAACKPQLRPIAEMPAEVPEGYERVTGYLAQGVWYVGSCRGSADTHFIDIALPSPIYPADFEQAFAESKLDAKDKAAAFKLWKGGAR